MSLITDWVDTKHNHILEELHSLFDEGSEKKLKASTFMHPIICNVLNLDNPKSRKEDNREFTDAEDIEYCLRSYQAVTAEINVFTLLVPSIETFAMFMGWTSALIKHINENATPEIQAVMDLVDDYIIDAQMTAGQNGITRASMARFRVQAAGSHGHGMVTQKEENEEKRSEKKRVTKDEMEKYLESTGSNLVKIEEK